MVIFPVHYKTSDKWTSTGAYYLRKTFVLIDKIFKVSPIVVVVVADNLSTNRHWYISFPEVRQFMSN